MRFIVHKSAFERVDGVTPFGTVILKLKDSGRELSLNKTAVCLLDNTDKERDTDELFSGCDEALQKDLRKGLTLLSAFEIAEIFDDPRNEDKDIRIAGERDYREISAFLTKSDNITYGNFKNDIAEYFNEDNVRARQFSNFEYNFLYRPGGVIKGVLLMVMPREYTFEKVCRTEWIVLAPDLKDSDTEIIKNLLTYAQKMFKNEFPIYRYLHIRDDDKLLSILQAVGFEKTANLEEETSDNKDVEVYDQRK